MPPTSDDRLVVRLTVIRTGGLHELTFAVRCVPGATWDTVQAAGERAGLTLPDHVYARDTPVHGTAVVGAPPLLNSRVLTDRPLPPRSRRLLELVAAEGPDTGRRVTLTGHPVTVGRDLTCDLRVHDPDVSREHCTVTLTQGRVTVTDLGSTNGTVVGHEPLACREQADLQLGARLRIGSTTLSLARAQTPRDGEGDDHGRLLVHRAPRADHHVRALRLEAPRPPAPVEPRRMPWAMALLPLVLAGAMVLVLHNTFYLMFALLSPAMIVAQHLTDKRAARRGERHHDDEYASKLAEFSARRESTLRAELVARRRTAPPLPDLLHAAACREDHLWERAPHHSDHLLWRIGTGTVPSGTVVHDAAGDHAEPLAHAPVTVSLTEQRVTGVCGDPAAAARLIAGLLVQLGTLHAPGHVRLVILRSADTDPGTWVWAHPLPHLTPDPAGTPAVFVADAECARFKALLARLAETGSTREADGGPPPHTVVLLDHAAACLSVPGVSELLPRARQLGLTFVALASARDELPTACEVVVEIDERRATVTGAVSSHAVPDLPTWQLSREAVRLLGGLRDVAPADATSRLPHHTRLLPLLHKAFALDLHDPQDVCDHWARAGRSTEALLGVDTAGPLLVDLAVQGPHALLAGTTGAGKSELLQTLILSLAARNRPDQMVFVLVDYKGGAAFKDCAQLPHTVGLVTDLDAQLTGRALRSLEAELHRREQLLQAVGAKDIVDYHALARAEPLPRLVLVIDEFRVLAEELPDFITGLVRIATVGRSLGIHLVLATQRPAGVVSADIRANVNLRIALRVRDDSDSQDVVGTTAAARISAAEPGRGVLRAGGGSPIAFQAARIGGPATGEQDAVEIALVDPVTGAPRWPAADEDTGRATDLQLAVQALVKAADLARLQPPASPWLAPLPPLLRAQDLGDDATTLSGERVTATESWTFALADLPNEQAVRAVGWCPEVDGHLSIVGGPRSGRTCALRTLAVRAARATPPTGLHLYVLDGSGGLSALAALPHCGAVIGRDDIGRVDRLIAWLAEEIAQRQARFAATGVSGYAEHTAGSRSPSPRVVLVIDGWDTFSELSDEATGGRLFDDLSQVLRDGASVGVYAVATGGRGLAGSRASASFPTRIALRMNDETDLLMLGLRSAQVPGSMPPGRGLLLPDATELQIAVLGAQATGRGQSDAVASAASTAAPCDPSLRTFHPIPTVVARADLPPTTPGCLVLGLGGDAVEGVGLPTPDSGLAALVAGPTRSGRTTALVTAAAALAGHRPVAVVGGADVPDPVTTLDARDPAAIGTWCTAYPHGALLVDDVERLVGSCAEEALLAHLSRVRATGGIVVAAGLAGELNGVFRGLVPELRRAQTGVLLQPGRHDGDLLGIRIGPLGRPRPGHGVLVVRGRAQEIQLAR